MNRVAAALGVLLTLFVIVVATPVCAQVRDARPVPPGAAPNAAPTGTGALAGVVVADESSRPLRQAAVVLIGATTGVLKVSSTDSEGRFSFDALPKDAYTVAASKQPYLGAVAGAKRPARPGSSIAVANDQRVSGVTIRLPRAAVITGTLMDELGQPTNAFVWVQRRQMRNGELTLTAAGQITNADETGRYRVWGLPPGDYVVSAFRSSSPTYKPRVLTESDVDVALHAITTVGTAPSADTSAAALSRPVPIFYPGSARPEEATVLSLTAGEERAGIDIRIDRMSSVRIEGAVSSDAGALPQRATAVLMTAAGQGPFSSAMGSAVGPDGRFNIPNVVPGKYVLSVTAQGPTPLSAVIPVDATSGDVTGISAVLRPPLAFGGRVVFDGVSPPAPAGITVPFTPMRTLVAQNVGGPGARPVVSTSDSSGAFRITDVTPGRYIFGGAMYFGPNALSTNWTLQSVVVDGRDVTDAPVDITPETLPKDLAVKFTDKWQGVSGKLQTSEGQPATDYTVVIFPADKNYWTFGSRRIASARPATDGSFTLGGSGIASLPPGQYVLAAVTDVAKDEQYDPALLNQLITAGTPITLAPGERKVQGLVIR